MSASTRFAVQICLIALPIVAVAADWPLWLTVLVLVLILLGGLVVRLARLGKPHRGPELELESIGASHFVEKVRWCLDRLGVAYVEKPWAGTFGAFYKGRSVPTLHVRGRGLGPWAISNSSDILRYVWGRFGEGNPQAEFLRPTIARAAMEERLDAYGRDLQRWVYFHLLPHRQLTLRAWGAEDPAVAWWQRLLIKLLFPVHKLLVSRAFGVSRRGFEKSRERIEALLTELEATLSDAPSITGEPQASYCDLTLAALSGLWLQPPEFGGGRSEAVRIPLDQLPDSLQADRAQWREQFPRVTAHIEELYAARTLQDQKRINTEGTEITDEELGQ